MFLFSAVRWFFSAAYMGHRNTAKSVWKNEWMYCVKSESHLGQFLPEYLSWYVKLALPLPFVEDPMLYAFLKERLCIQNSFKFFHEIFGSITKYLSNIEVHIWDYPLFDETINSVKRFFLESHITVPLSEVSVAINGTFHHKKYFWKEKCMRHPYKMS